MKDQLKNRIEKAYSVYRSIRKVASIVGVSYGSVHAVLQERSKLLPWSGFDRVKRWQGGNRGIVARWVERHPSVVMPVKVEDIAKMVGCSRKDAHSWKVARWARMKRVMKMLKIEKVVKRMNYARLEIVLEDGQVLKPDLLFDMEKKLKRKEAADGHA